MKILPNGIAVIENDSHHALWIEMCGKLIHDPWMADNICRHLHHGDVAFDCGANIGTITAAMIDVGATVYAFEPNLKAAECLERNCPEAYLYTVGLSDSAGSAKMNQLENAGASHISEEGVPVEIETIDRMVFDPKFPIPIPSVIKMDIEGYELKALRGAVDTISQAHPVLILEVNRGALERAGDSEYALLEFVARLGYSWSILQPDCKRGDEQYDIECIFTGRT